MSNKYVDYYQSANFRDNSGSIMHYRTKISEGGSPNGYTKDPNYDPVGQIARMVNGKYASTTTAVKGNKYAYSSQKSPSTLGDKIKGAGKTISTKLDHLVKTPKEREEEKQAAVRAQVKKEDEWKQAAKNTHITGGTGGKKIIDEEEDHKDTDRAQIEKGQRIVDRANELSGRSEKDTSKQISEDGTMNKLAKVRKENADAAKKVSEAKGKDVRQARSELVKAKDEEYDVGKKYTDNSEEAQAQKLAASMKKNDAQKKFDDMKDARKKRLLEDLERYKNKLKNRLS